MTIPSVEAPPALQLPADDADGPSLAGYSQVAIVLHWVIAALILTNFALGWTAHLMEESSIDQTITNLHKSFGVSILLLSLLRLLWRFGHRPPALPNAMPNWEKSLARAGHALLYGLMLAVPLAGWWMSSAFPARHSFRVFELVELPFLPVATGMGPAFAAHDVHRWLAVTMIALVIGHAAAAFRHHYILRDDVLSRMSLHKRKR